MQLIPSYINGLVEIKSRLLTDGRGFLFELCRQKAFAEHGVPASFVQDNQSFSRSGVLRSPHIFWGVNQFITSQKYQLLPTREVFLQQKSC